MYRLTKGYSSFNHACIFIANNRRQKRRKINAKASQIPKIRSQKKWLQWRTVALLIEWTVYMRKTE